MSPVSKDVLDFIRACEAIHGRLAQGEPFTAEERWIIVSSSSELLSKLKAA